MKRKDYISWDEYFMGIALLSAKRSKDPSTQVGACIVNQFNKIVGIGYNGFPIGCSDDELPWARSADDSNKTKYPYVVHAEANAILNSTKDLHGSRMYVALFPCNECTKLIIQSGIKKREIIITARPPRRFLPRAEFLIPFQTEKLNGPATGLMSQLLPRPGIILMSKE